MSGEPTLSRRGLLRVLGAIGALLGTTAPTGQDLRGPRATGDDPAEDPAGEDGRRDETEKRTSRPSETVARYWRPAG